jgi:hypothetical protein
MTKDPRNPNRWTNREIEADTEGYLAAQAAHAEDREEGERQRREADDLTHFTEDSWRPAGRAARPHPRSGSTKRSRLPRPRSSRTRRPGPTRNQRPGG